MSSVTFANFELRPNERLLLRDQVPVPLGDRALDLLLALLERPGQLVDKDMLMLRAWPGRVMAESNLTVQMSALRKALGSQAVRTVAGRGYMFALPVQAPMALVLDGDPPAPQPAGVRQLPSPGDGPWLAPEAPVLLYAGLVQASTGLSLRGALPEITAWVDLALRQLVAAHGGQLLESRAGRSLASFYGVRDAVSCCRQLREGLRSKSLGQPEAIGARLQLALHRADGPPQLAANMAERLAALAEEGQIIASAAAASQFVPALDGDIEDLGDRHLAVHLGPLRVYSLMPHGAPDLVSAPGRLVGGAAELRPTVAVLTPHHQGDWTATAEVGDIVADQLIAALSRSPVLNVISRLTSHSLRHRTLSARQVGQLLSADFVVSGRSMRQGGRLRVNIEIADGRSGRVLGAHAAEDLDSAALHADSSLVQSLLGAITRAVFQQELQVARVTPLPNLATHTLLLAGIGLLYRLSRPDFERAHELLDQARRRAPHHAAPLVWLARWHLFKAVQGWSHDRAQDGQLALDLARRALDLDPDSSLALTMLGNIHTMVLRDLPGAEKHLNMALAIDPNESLAWLQLGNVRSFSGDGATALAHSQRASRLSPLDPARHYYLSLLASAALSANELDTAINTARKSLRLNQSYISTHRVLTIALALAGRMEEAHAAMAQLRLLEPLLTVADFVARSPGALSGLAHTFGQALLAAGLPAGRR